MPDMVTVADPVTLSASNMITPDDGVVSVLPVTARPVATHSDAPVTSSATTHVPVLYPVDVRAASRSGTTSSLNRAALTPSTTRPAYPAGSTPAVWPWPMDDLTHSRKTLLSVHAISDQPPYSCAVGT